MNFTLEQRKFFIDPIQDPLGESKKILVTEERWGRGRHAHTIAEVKGLHTDDNRVWWTTTSGDYVCGAPVNPRFEYGTPVMGILADNLFVIGAYNGLRGDNLVSVTGAVRSDALTLPLRPGEGMSMGLATAVKAAPWALELLPKPGDPDSVTAAKLALAKQRWEQRHAKAIITQQALYREWWDDMEELRNNHDLPAPRLGGLFVGNVLVYLNRSLDTEALTEAQKADLEQKKERAYSASNPSGQYTAIRATLPMRLTVNSPDDLKDLRHENMLSTVRSVMGDYSVQVSDYSISPVLRSAA